MAYRAERYLRMLATALVKCSLYDETLRASMVES
jgi:hypothetical protein